jgi:hypothetical protein
MAVTRIKNNQITDLTITAQKIAKGTLVGDLFSPNLTLNSNVTIAGNLAVMGESSTVSSTNTYVNDPLVVFNNGYAGLPAYDVGMLINRSLNPINAAWVWSENDDAFVGVLTTETGGTSGAIDKTAFADLKVGNLTALTSTLSNIVVSGTTVSPVASLTNADITLDPNGTGVVSLTSTITPATALVTADLGKVTAPFNELFVKTIDINGATISTAGGDLTLTGPDGGDVVVANLVISGSGSTFTGNIVSGNVTITGGTINGTTVGATTAAAGTFTDVSIGGNLSVTGSTTLTSVTATSGTLSNVAVSATTLSTSGATTLANTTATSLTTANAQVTGGAVSNVTITNSAISGAAGSFTTLEATGDFTAMSAATLEGITHITDTTQSTMPTDGALIVDGGVGVAKNVNVGGNLDVDGTAMIGTVSVENGEISTSSDLRLYATGAVKIGALTMPQVDGTAGSVMTTDGAGNISLTSVGAAISGNLIPLGTPTVGTLVDNNPAIVTFATTTKVTDAVDQLNEILGKLVPPQPPVFPNATTIAIQSLSSGKRMTDFAQTNNTLTGSKQVAAGTAVSNFRTAASYSTNVIDNVGPGSSGTVSVMKNGVSSGSRTMVESFVGANNGTYGELIISDNADYSTKFVPARPLLFWTSFDAAASGTVAAGWNEVYLTDTAGTPTNTAVWYYDSSAPGTPVVTASSFTPTSEVTALSSSVPHYTSATTWTAAGTANRLSGDLYPATDTFLTGSAGGSFQAPASVTYAGASVATPLARNLYVASGSASFSTIANTVNVTGSSSAGVTLSVNNSYATGTGTATPGGTVLTINTSSTAKVNETNIVVGTFGTGGSASAVRVGGLASGATPTTGSITAWDSASLPTHEGTVVAGVAKYDVTNYSTGYFPVGPDLSTGRTATQYMTFRIQRDAVSKFDIAVTGKFSACHVAMPGSALDTTAAPTNGWVDATVAYAGSGVPGTGVGGNGSAGAALGGALTVGSSVTQSKTVTFGTESSHNSSSYYIYVRFTLAAGDSITALSFANPTH